MSDDWKDPRWQKLRLQIFERDGWKCVACGDSQETLCVHHLVYGGKPWDVEDRYLQTLCEPCHQKLGLHPKGGIWWIPPKHKWNDRDVPVVFVNNCPKCCGQLFRDRDLPCCEKCKWSTNYLRECAVPLFLSSGISFIEKDETIKKAKTYSLGWLAGMITKIRKGGATDEDLFRAMFPESPATAKLLLAIEAIKAGIRKIENNELTTKQEVALASEAIYARSYVNCILDQQRDEFEELRESFPSAIAMNNWLKAGETVGGLAQDFCGLATGAAWRGDVLEVSLPATHSNAASFLNRSEIAAALSCALSEIARRSVTHSILFVKELDEFEQFSQF